MQVQAPPRLPGLAMDSFVGVLASAEDDLGAEASSPLAIHVYSNLAKLHKHRLIPYLPRIMASVLSSLSCSPQLHPACAQVVADLATHTIDSSRDPASNEETLRKLCHPLLSTISGSQPPHLAAGVALCLRTLVESSRWACAPLDLQENVCTKGTDALMNEGTQTVAHMELMKSLAKLSSSIVIQGYGASLLEAGMEILHNSRDTEQRVAAAQLLQSMLRIADAELLDLDLSPIVGVLQECQQDRAPGVRSAAADALKTASQHVTSCDYASQRAQALLSHQNSQQSSLGGGQAKLRPSSPPCGYGVHHPNLAPPNVRTPCHGTPFVSTPSSTKSNKWLKRLPLAPLQQSPLVNVPLVASSRRQPARFKHLEQKENIAPPNQKARFLTSLRDGSRRTWMQNRDSPILWPKDTVKKAHSEGLNLFNSPQTPIVPFCEEDEAEDGSSSVSFLLEKHFGKQRDGFEEQLHFPLRESNTNRTCSAREETCYPREECGGGKVCNSFEQNRKRPQRFGSGKLFDSSSIDSKRTASLCGSERPYSPSQDSVSEGESGTTLEEESKFLVTNNLPTIDGGDLLMTPKRLICSLQSADEYRSDSDREGSMDSEAGCSMCDSDVLEEDNDGDDDDDDEDDDDDDLNLKTDTEESIDSSPSLLLEDYNLHCEWDDAQMSMTKKENGSGRQKGFECQNLTDIIEAGTSLKSNFLSCGREGCSEEDGRNQVMRRHVPEDDGDECAGADDRINGELRASKPAQRGACARVRPWGKAQGLLLLVMAALGLFCGGVILFMGSLEASIMLVPT